jgi:hypothetical protein
LPLFFISYCTCFDRSHYSSITHTHTLNQTPWPESASELYRPSDSRLSAKLVPTFGDRGCHAASATDPSGRILGFLDRCRYYFFPVAPQLYSRGGVDPFQTHYFSENLIVLGIEVCCLSINKDYVSQLIHFTLLHFSFVSFQFVPHKKHNTSPFCSQEVWPSDHRCGLLFST